MTGPGTSANPRPRSAGLYVAIGVLLTLVVVLAIVLVILLNGTAGLASATATPGTSPSQVAIASTVPGAATPGASGLSGNPETSAAATIAPPTSGVTAPATVPPTTAPLRTTAPATPHPTTAATQPAKTPSPTTPTATPKPSIVTFSGPTHSTTCGSGVTVHLTWSVTNISSVRLSIDPPTAAQGYTYFFDDYPAATGSADLPFACSPPNSDANGAYHLYVLTIKSGTFSTYRYVKVYA